MSQHRWNNGLSIMEFLAQFDYQRHLILARTALEHFVSVATPGFQHYMEAFATYTQNRFSVNIQRLTQTSNDRERQTLGGGRPDSCSRSTVFRNFPGRKLFRSSRPCSWAFGNRRGCSIRERISTIPGGKAVWITSSMNRIAIGKLTSYPQTCNFRGAPCTGPSVRKPTGRSGRRPFPAARCFWPTRAGWVTPPSGFGPSPPITALRSTSPASYCKWSRTFSSP